MQLGAHERVEGALGQGPVDEEGGEAVGHRQRNPVEQAGVDRIVVAEHFPLLDEGVEDVIPVVVGLIVELNM